MSVLRTWRFIVRHPLGRLHRVDSLIRWARWQLGARILPYPIIYPFVNNAQLAIEAGMTGATGNIYVGLHEFVDMAFVIHSLRPGDLFLDLGANVGAYTVLASAVSGAGSIACEPIQGTYDRLKRNIRLNRIESLVDAQQSAVGATAGTLRFIADRDTTNRVAPAGYSGATANVPVVTVDSIFDSVPGSRSFVLWKADLEGHEPAMLQGARQSLGAGLPHAMLVESDCPEVVRTLGEHRFVRVTYNPFDRELSEYQGSKKARNYLWIREHWFALVRERVVTAPRFFVQGIWV